MPDAPPTYPAAPRLDLVDDLHGHAVPDPYRWLEDAGSPETVAWSDAQDAVWASVRDRLSARASFAARLPALLPGLVGAPAWRGERAFYLRRSADQQLPVLLLREADGRERALIDPMALSPDGTVTLDAAEASPEGGLLAYQTSAGGTEESVLHVLDVDTGDVVDGPIERCRYSPIAWLPDADGFYYMRKLSADEAPDGDGELHRRVWFHALGTDWRDDPLVFGTDSAKGTYFGLDLSLDGRWLLLTASIGTAPRTDVWLLDRHGPDEWRPVIVGADAETYGRFGDDGLLYLRTDLDAPRGRLAVCEPAAAEPTAWRDVLPESEHPLTSWALADGTVVAVRTADVVSRVTIHDRASGRPLAPVELPGLGSAEVVGRPGGAGSEVWVHYADFATPGVVLEVAVAGGATSTWAAIESPADLAVRQVFATSPDGTRVPVFLLEPPGERRPRPTILYGYGGFGVSMSPDYAGTWAAWVEAGGAFAVACLRGGLEYGEEWHRAGMRERKQNVFDDLYAAAGLLIDEGVAAPGRLGISGGSNGGLLVGAALTQRPELFRSVVCSAPLLDMVRYERFGLGSTWNDEYGRADDPAELAWLLSYSPYHHVVEGTAYPAVLFTVFDGDTRVDPLHARKLCAALQHASASDPATHPVALRRERDVGHGQRSLDRSIELAADQLAFHAAMLGLGPG